MGQNITFFSSIRSLRVRIPTLTTRSRGVPTSHFPVRTPPAVASAGADDVQVNVKPVAARIDRYGSGHGHGGAALGGPL